MVCRRLSAASAMVRRCVGNELYYTRFWDFVKGFFAISATFFALYSFAHL